MSQTLNQLDKEYLDLQTKYKNNYKVAEFYPTVSSVSTYEVGCVSPNSVKFQRVQGLHTPDSCKTAVSMMSRQTDTSASKTAGLQYTLKPSSGDAVSGISTNFQSIALALGDKAPPQQTKYTVMWEGVIIPDIDGKWTFTLSTNSVAYLWMGATSIETHNEFNADVKIDATATAGGSSKSTSLSINKGEKVHIRLRYEHNNVNVSPAFSFTLEPPSGSSPNMYDSLFVLKNSDGSLYKPPQMYYSFVENSPEDTAKNLFQCHYATSLDGTVPYKPMDNTNGFYHSTDQVLLSKLFATDESIIKPGNTIRLDNTGVHIFNAQNVIVKTLYSFNKSPLVQYIRIERNEEKNEPIMLNINEIEVYDEKGKIPSNEMAAKVSPQYGNSNNFGAQYLIDGNTSSKKQGVYNLPHTTANINAYMEIDLLKGRKITKVLVHNRNDCCKERVLRGQLVLLDANRKRVCRVPITQIMNVYEFSISKDGCATSSSASVVSNEGTGMKYTLLLQGNEKRVELSVIRENPSSKKWELEAALFQLNLSQPAYPSYKWKMEKDANEYKEISDVISFSRPLISGKSRFKLMIDSMGNVLLYGSHMGCQSNKSAGGISYRSLSKPEENQYIYGVQADSKFNKTYYVDEMDKTMQYLPRDNPMLVNTANYTEVVGYVPTEEMRKGATSVENADDCKKKCNDISGCPWYSIFKSGTKQNCVLGTTQPKNILSPEMMIPVESVSGIQNGSIHVRNKTILFNPKYMLEDNIPFTQIMKSIEYAPYSSYQVNASPIEGETPIGLLSEKEVQDYFPKQNRVLGNGKTITEGMENGGIEIIPDSNGQIENIRTTYLNPSLEATRIYNNRLAAMRTNEGSIRSRIREYEQVRSKMEEDKRYRFHPDHITTFRDPPTLVDGIVEDNKEMIYQQNLAYATTGIAVVALGIAAVMVASRASA